MTISKKAQLDTLPDGQAAVAPPTRHAEVDTSGGDVSFAGDPPRVLFIGGAGDVVVSDMNGDDETYTVPAGFELAGFFTAVKQTGTDATNIIARW